MPQFNKYIHLEKLGHPEVQGIDHGEIYLFPKLDGTNGSIWLGDDGQIKAGSRNRELSLENDNRGFYAWVQQQDSLKEIFNYFPGLTLYGEWLVPHTIKTYDKDAWNHFYVFDVMAQNSFIRYENYARSLESFEIDVIHPHYIIHGQLWPDWEATFAESGLRNYLGNDIDHEGIVIKNYDFVNQFGRQCWAKVINPKYTAYRASKGLSVPKDEDIIEQTIAREYVTKHLVDKTLAKIPDFTNRQIPRLLQTVYYDLIREESWEFLKQFKNPTINFKTLQRYAEARVKELLPEIF